MQYFDNYPGVHIKLYVRCPISETLEFKITQRVAAAVVMLILWAYSWITFDLLTEHLNLQVLPSNPYLPGNPDQSTMTMMLFCSAVNLSTGFVCLLTCHSHSTGLVDFFVTLLYTLTIGYKVIKKVNQTSFISCNIVVLAKVF